MNHEIIFFYIFWGLALCALVTAMALLYEQRREFQSLVARHDKLLRQFSALERHYHEFIRIEPGSDNEMIFHLSPFEVESLKQAAFAYFGTESRDPKVERALQTFVEVSKDTYDAIAPGG